MKSKSNVKRDHSLGTLNKNKIWNIIPGLCQKKGFENGITLTDILKESKAKFPPNGYSKPTIIKALKKFEADDRLLKIKSRYFLVDIFEDDGWSIFGRYLNFLLLNTTFHNKSVNVTRISHPDPERDLGEIFLQFSNFIGIFVLYILIEAMRPTRKLVPRPLRIDKALSFIQTAMPHKDLLTAFLKFLPPIHNKDIVLGAEIRRDRINKFSNAFRYIYPSIHETLEGGYIQYFKNCYLDIQDKNFDHVWKNDIQDAKCDHVWKKTFFHKLGRWYYSCTRCTYVVNSRP